MNVYKYNLLIFLLLFVLNTLSAQSVSPAVIGSNGGFKKLGDVSISFTVGEPVTTTIKSNSGVILTQGFQQPSKISIIIDETDSIHIYTGITPNGDNQNDTWIIDNVADKNCNVRLFNRWGDLVWKGDNYNNTDVVWSGDNMHNQPLPPATYFYVITIRSKTYKGWVELTR
jgi:gliding motility-associated-like protein